MDDLALLLGKRFLEQRDVKAWQSADGAYYPDRSKLTKADVLAHLGGAKTLGHYVVSGDNKARVLTFDIDVVKPKGPRESWPEGTINMRDEFANPQSLWRVVLIKQLNAMAVALARRTHKLLDVHVAAAFSGSKGVHVYGFFPAGTPAGDVRAAGVAVLDSFQTGRVRFTNTRGKNFFGLTEFADSYLEVEVYPKQDEQKEHDGAVGNLVRLPLGVNRKSGKRGCFIRFDKNWDVEFTEMDAAAALTGTLPW